MRDRERGSARARTASLPGAGWLGGLRGEPNTRGDTVRMPLADVEGCALCAGKEAAAGRLWVAEHAAKRQESPVSLGLSDQGGIRPRAQAWEPLWVPEVRPTCNKLRLGRTWGHSLHKVALCPSDSIIQ